MIDSFTVQRDDAAHGHLRVGDDPCLQSVCDRHPSWVSATEIGGEHGLIVSVAFSFGNTNANPTTGGATNTGGSTNNMFGGGNPGKLVILLGCNTRLM